MQLGFGFQRRVVAQIQRVAQVRHQTVQDGQNEVEECKRQSCTFYKLRKLVNSSKITRQFLYPSDRQFTAVSGSYIALLLIQVGGLMQYLEGSIGDILLRVLLRFMLVAVLNHISFIRTPQLFAFFLSKEKKQIYFRHQKR